MLTVKLIAKFCSMVIIVMLAIVALGPAEWQPRSPFGWEIDHFVGYFVITSIVLVAWPRPIVVGGALMIVAALLEGLQYFTPDRHANLMATIYGAGGALVAALTTRIFMRTRRRRAG